MKYILAILSVLASVSCQDVLFDDVPENTPESNFEVFWKDFDQYYSFFELKKINWDSVYALHRPSVNSTTSTDSLLRIINKITHSLKDGHASLFTGSRWYFFDYTAGYPKNYLPSLNRYVTLQRNSPAMQSGIIGNQIGYIQILTFGGTRQNFEVIDSILKSFDKINLTGVIIDVRQNGGGSDEFSQLIANRFTSSKKTYSYFKYRNGPSHHNFGSLNEKQIQPEGYHYTKHVAVLTNRRVFSSAEDFVLAMKATDHAIIVGDTTGGGSGNPIDRVLPNGWLVKIPRWIAFDSNMKTFEGVGIIPDIPVWITKKDSLANMDTILEKAIQEIKK